MAETRGVGIRRELSAAAVTVGLGALLLAGLLAAAFGAWLSSFHFTF